MGDEVLIQIRDADLGSHPEAFALNASFRKTLPLLKLCVEIDWEPKVPGVALTSLEASLLDVCPSLRDHQCRGDEAYHVLRSTDGKGRPPGEDAPEIEAALALAHLFEHVIIDAISYITGEPVISGATAALAGSLTRFDIFVESPDAAVARLTVGLARSWITAIVTGASQDGSARVVLDLCRYLYQARPRPVDVRAAARGLACDPARIRGGLGWLARNRLVRRVPYTMNFSGLAYYGLTLPGPKPVDTSPSRPTG